MMKKNKMVQYIPSMNMIQPMMALPGMASS
jgi:hypothetical protein